MEQVVETQPTKMEKEESTGETNPSKTEEDVVVIQSSPRKEVGTSSDFIISSPTEEEQVKPKKSTVAVKVSKPKKTENSPSMKETKKLRSYGFFEDPDLPLDFEKWEKLPQSWFLKMLLFVCQRRSGTEYSKLESLLQNAFINEKKRWLLSRDKTISEDSTQFTEIQTANDNIRNHIIEILASK